MYSVFYKFFENWLEGEFDGNSYIWYVVTFDILNTGMERKTIYNSINPVIDLICWS